MYRSSHNSSPIVYKSQYTTDFNGPAKRSELVEFRNYVRQTAYAKLEQPAQQPQQRKIFAQTMHQSSKSFMNASKPLFVQSKVYEQQTLPSSRGNNVSPYRVDWKINRSNSQIYAQFDANTWKENLNSFSRDKSSQSNVTVSDIIKLNNRLNMISTKEAKEFNTSYLTAVQDLEQTISGFLRRIDNKII